MSETRCRAKDRNTCARHGNKRALGTAAQAHIIKYLTEGKRYPIAKSKLRELPLKELNAAGLAVAVSEYARATPGLSQERVNAAILFATDVHRKDYRANRGKYPYTPYIEHPLRNTLRVIRYGCKDEATIIACLLHDTVEDHPFEIAKHYAGVNTKDESEAREAAFTYIQQQWGAEAARIVRGMSNPVETERPDNTEAEKREIYAGHVREAIREPKTALGKISDLVDNAASLHHTLTGMKAEAIQRKARKYSAVWGDVEKRVQQERFERRFPISDDGLLQIEEHLALGRKRLDKFALTPVESW